MSFTTIFIAALFILPAIGLLTWVWFAMARVKAELRAFSGFEGMHFND